MIPRNISFKTKVLVEVGICVFSFLLAAEHAGEGAATCSFRVQLALLVVLRRSHVLGVFCVKLGLVLGAKYLIWMSMTVMMVVMSMVVMIMIVVMVMVVVMVVAVVMIVPIVVIIIVVVFKSMLIAMFMSMHVLLIVIIVMFMIMMFMLHLGSLA
jgi:hypothetical protein